MIVYQKVTDEIELVAYYTRMFDKYSLTLNAAPLFPYLNLDKKKACKIIIKHLTIEFVRSMATLKLKEN